MKFKILIIIFISLTFLLFKSDMSIGCGPDYSVNENIYNLLNPNSISSKELSIYNFTFNSFFEPYLEGDSLRKYDNLKDWTNSIGINRTFVIPSYVTAITHLDTLEQYEQFINYRITDFDNLIYKSKLEDIQEIQKYINSKPNKLNLNGIHNEVFNFIIEHSLFEVINYIEYTKKCELVLNKEGENSSYNQVWISNDTISNDSAQMQELIIEGKNLIKFAKYDYLKMRYTFQLTRLAHYSSNFNQCIELFNKNLPKSQINTLMYFWALEHKAGALKKLKNNSEANYLYLQVFANCRSKSFRAFQCIKVNNKEDWDSTFNLCKTSKEKCALFAIRGIDYKNSATDELEEIAKIDPNSKFIPLLISRELTKLEYILLNSEFKRSRYVNFTKSYSYGISNNKYTETNLLNLSEFISGLLNNPKLINKATFLIANGYLSFLKGNISEAKQKFLECEFQSNLNQNQLSQIKAFKLAIFVNEIPKMNDSLETQVFEDFKNILVLDQKPNESFNMLLKYILDKIAYIYYKQGEYGKSFLCIHSPYEIRSNPNENAINDILSLVDKKDKNDFENFLLKNPSSLTYYFNYIESSIPSQNSNNINSVLEEDNLKNDLLEIKATLMISQNRVQEAIDIFKLIKKSYLKTSEYYNLKCDPFQSYLEGIYNFNFHKYSSLNYNKLTFAQKILELEKTIKNTNDNEVLANSYLQLGNAFYNISFFGPCWKTIDYYKSYNVFDNTNELDSNVSIPKDMNYFDFYICFDTTYTDMKKSEKYFNKALELTNNKEFKAKISFMLAKCEQNGYYLKVSEEDKSYFVDFNDEKYKNIKQQYQSWFSILKNQYSDTEFYKEALSNCSYFSNYINKH